MDTGMQAIGAQKPVDLGAQRKVTVNGVVYTYQRSPSASSAFISAALEGDITGNAPAISAYMFADDARCAALTADEFVTMLRARFSALVSVLG